MPVPASPVCSLSTRFNDAAHAARVVIADDHTLIREGLRNVLGREPDMRVVGEASSGPELISLLQGMRADVVLLDINMPGEGSVETLQRIRAMRPEVPVLILSVLPEDQVATRFIRLGAAGYVSKWAAAEELVNAIRSVLGGTRYVSPALAERLAIGRGRPSHESLSRRELQVLRRIAGGRSVKQIADELGVSVSTVHTHRSHVLDKLSLRSDVELTRYAVAHHLVD
jgi:two-component system invasion response regulator UvrY